MLTLGQILTHQKRNSIVELTLFTARSSFRILLLYLLCYLFDGAKNVLKSQLNCYTYFIFQILPSPEAAFLFHAPAFPRNIHSPMLHCAF